MTTAEDNLTGYIGECWVRYQLARRGIRTAIIPNEFASYDLLTRGGNRIEIKTGRPVVGKRPYDRNPKIIYKWEKWTFNNQKNRFQYKNGKILNKCKANKTIFDFFVCVCMDKNKNPIKSYIIPYEVVKNKKSLCIPLKARWKSKQKQYDKYLEKWEQVES